VHILSLVELELSSGVLRTHELVWRIEEVGLSGRGMASNVER
jgi:hypothetical protein